MVRNRLAYDEIFANQLALLLIRQANRRRRTVPLNGDGRIVDRDAGPEPRLTMAEGAAGV